MRKAMMLGLALAGIVALPNAAVAEDCHGSHWGEVTPKGCSNACEREYSGILWDIPWGSRWEICCRQTAHPSLGLPHHCEHGGGIWGVWLRKDKSCPGPCPPPSCPKGKKWCEARGECLPERQLCIRPRRFQ
jgi:hypothetical protein